MAVAAARRADVCILCVGNNTGTEGEASDRSCLDLPGIRNACGRSGKSQQTLRGRAFRGSAVTMARWNQAVPGIIHAWYPGEEGGTAVAEILFGAANPSGKLPITYPRTTGQVPLYYNAKPTGRLDDYNDLRGPQPLFAFGHGLQLHHVQVFEPVDQEIGEGPGRQRRHLCRDQEQRQGTRR